MAVTLRLDSDPIAICHEGQLVQRAGDPARGLARNPVRLACPVDRAGGTVPSAHPLDGIA